ncbi:hypothetical protein GCM10009850_087470 [Nonomuraea monospora]|uniref:Uncharacterized protein n=1 Tax=Nonomuraea monospora TaxID=568818 RepID=A0ABP5PNK3_9ACTN
MSAAAGQTDSGRCPRFLSWAWRSGGKEEPRKRVSGSATVDEAQGLVDVGAEAVEVGVVGSVMWVWPKVPGRRSLSLIQIPAARPELGQAV